MSKHITQFFFLTLCACGVANQAHDMVDEAEDSYHGNFAAQDGEDSSTTASSAGGTGDSGDGFDTSFSTGSMSSESGESESTGIDESSTGMEQLFDPYEDCWAGVPSGPPSCSGSCLVSGDNSVCAPDCPQNGCPGLMGWDALCLSEEADEVAAPVCFLPCATEGEPCPFPMQCEPLEYTQGGQSIMACLWP